MTRIESQGQRASLPVEPHLSIEGNFVSPADETEPLAASVERRPRACVRIVRACSVSFAELTFRDVFAAVIILPNIFLQIRKSLHFASDHEKVFVRTRVQSGQTRFSWIQNMGPPLLVHIRVWASHLVLQIVVFFIEWTNICS